MAGAAMIGILIVNTVILYYIFGILNQMCDTPKKVTIFNIVTLMVLIGILVLFISYYSAFPVYSASVLL